MDAPEDRTLYTTEALSAQGELFESMNDIFDEYYCGFEHEKAHVQIFVVKRYGTRHFHSSPSSNFVLDSSDLGLKYEKETIAHA